MHEAAHPPCQCQTEHVEAKLISSEARGDWATTNSRFVVRQLHLDRRDFVDAGARRPRRRSASRGVCDRDGGALPPVTRWFDAADGARDGRRSKVKALRDAHLPRGARRPVRPDDGRRARALLLQGVEAIALGQRGPAAALGERVACALVACASVVVLASRTLGRAALARLGVARARRERTIARMAGDAAACSEALGWWGGASARAAPPTRPRRRRGRGAGRGAGARRAHRRPLDGLDDRAGARRARRCARGGGARASLALLTTTSRRRRKRPKRAAPNGAASCARARRARARRPRLPLHVAVPRRAAPRRESRAAAARAQRSRAADVRCAPPPPPPPPATAAHPALILRRRRPLRRDDAPTAPRRVAQRVLRGVGRAALVAGSQPPAALRDQLAAVSSWVFRARRAAPIVADEAHPAPPFRLSPAPAAPAARRWTLSAAQLRDLRGAPFRCCRGRRG